MKQRPVVGFVLSVFGLLLLFGIYKKSSSNPMIVMNSEALLKCLSATTTFPSNTTAAKGFSTKTSPNSPQPSEKIGRNRQSSTKVDETKGMPPKQSEAAEEMSSCPPVNCTVKCVDSTISGTDCVRTRTRPPYTICTHKKSEDIFVSGSILSSSRMWEQHVSHKIQSLMQPRPTATFLDLGGNIGIHAMLAAAMGRRVIALEPNPINLRKLQRSILLNGWTADQILVLPYAVSNESRKRLKLSSSGNNIGGSFVLHDNRSRLKPGETTTDIVSIQLDDLIPFINSQEVVVKIDIEGLECKAFSPNSSQQFLSFFHVPYICMEWMWQNIEDPSCVMAMINHFTANGFVPVDITTEKLLPIDKWKTLKAWPADICWKNNQKQSEPQQKTPQEPSPPPS